MIENIPSYVPITFILSTFLTIGFLFYAIKHSVLDSLAAKITIAAIAFWLFFTAILAIYGYYLKTDGFPPRFAFVAPPAFVFIAIIFVFDRKNFLEKLPLKILTILQVIRIPVEIGLFWLFQNGMIPEVMTFEGRNFDILAGITAPIVYWLAFRNRTVNRPLLIVWNIVCLILVTNIVVTAIFSLPSEFQQFGINQPNRAVLYFPYIWLPAIIVPIVYFAHFASLWQLFKNSTIK